MIDNAVKALKQRQHAVHEQLKSLRAEAGKLDKALSVLAQLSEVVTKKAPRAKKRKMSAAGRRAIGAAARARWAKLRAQKGAKAAAPVKKRRLSAAGRKAIIAAAKARWARIRAAQAK